MAPTTTPLDRDDPRVTAARSAEREAYDYYGFDPDEYYIDVPELDLQIRVMEVGTGPPVVLLPGGQGPGGIWIPFLSELRGYTAYVMDRPGGGLSDGIDYRSLPLHRQAASSTAALFDHFELLEAPLLGNSMGGLWSLRFALAHPDRVSGLALLGCPAVYPGTSAPFPMRLGSVSLISGYIVDTMMQSANVDDARETLEFLGHPSATANRLPEEFFEMWYHMEQLPHFKETWISLLPSVLSLRGANRAAAFTYEDLQAIRSPVCLIWGRNDPFGTVEAGKTGATHFQAAEFHEVGVGHLPWLDEPERCGKIVRAFIGREKSG
jgi:pimeloyl-ACP methyl ester carboxylesterase